MTMFRLLPTGTLVLLLLFAATPVSGITAALIGLALVIVWLMFLAVRP